ncbi:MAG: hypothetical protein K2Y28_08990 [Burkholderiaceae bacterium]|nr:hypothetical protein [Burkholderiaceae bacterium]
MRNIQFAAIVIISVSFCVNVAAKEDSCPFEKPVSQFDRRAPGVLEKSFKAVTDREAVEIVSLDSGDRVEVHYSGCEYEELKIRIDSSKFASLTNEGDIYKAAAIAIGRLSKYTVKNIYAYPFSDVSKALLRTGSLKTPPPFHTEIKIPSVEGMTSVVTIDSFTKNSAGGKLTISMNRGPL